MDLSLRTFTRNIHTLFTYDLRTLLLEARERLVIESERIFCSYIEKENSLGGNFTKKMPHCYQSERVKEDEGDAFVDVGTAEGLVALDVVDWISKVYIIESEHRWIKALHFEDGARILSDLFEQTGYHYGFSDEWMLFSKYDKSLLEPLFYHHGVIRA